MSEWTTSKLSDVIEIIGGGTPKRSETSYWNGNIPWLSVGDFNNDFRFVSNTSEKISKLGLQNSSTKLLKAGQLILSARGTVGCLAQLSIPMAFNQSCYGLNGKENIIDNGFLYYFLKNNINELKQKTHGSVFDTITRNTFEQINISYPNIKTQQVIARTLGFFDNKITLNTQTNQTLEQIAQGIFKHWFIDFAPVHAKANALARGETIEQAELAAIACLSGKTAEKITALKTQDPTTYHQLQQTAAAFPSEFVETEMGQVPKGWEVCSITDKRVCSIIKPKIHHFSGEKDYIATANVSQNTIVGELEKITFDNRPSRANMQPIVDSIWFAKMVGEHKAIMIDENDEFLLKNTILSTGFLGIKPQQYKKCFLYCFINSENFTLLKNSLATGAVQIALNNTSFSSMNIILPSDNVLEYFENKVSTLFSKIAASHRENKSLAETRDLLLPKLLNGEIEL
ncbi:restriction endonuclease subunit S [Gallibacterium anatis]|uniref:restriction endonuclease subunit S n=1 Tax=Gallibacterium anatis TaxID=750 RepID=UPI003005D2FB